MRPPSPDFARTRRTWTSTVRVRSDRSWLRQAPSYSSSRVTTRPAERARYATRSNSWQGRSAAGSAGRRAGWAAGRVDVAGVRTLTGVLLGGPPLAAAGRDDVVPR